ncbi:MAG: hypothetical protein ACYC3I_16225 [Gemmataceae bacterium]
MFILFFDEDKEILVNTDQISRIEVAYPEQDPKTGRKFETSVSYGRENLNAVRQYKVFFGNEPIIVPNGDNPLRKVVEDIYKNAIKGGGSKNDQHP